ncbi:MAG: NUDIX hydrolase, partial [Alteraurantiacibacter sp.]
MTKKFRQVAALPFRTSDTGAIEMLLVTTRGSRRWIPPKGWPLPGRTNWAAARFEALEEARVSGPIGSKPLGRFGYWKKSDKSTVHMVTVYPLRVTRMHKTWDEKMQRERRWFTPCSAADAVEFPQLRKLLKSLDPDGR